MPTRVQSKSTTGSITGPPASSTCHSTLTNTAGNANIVVLGVTSFDGPLSGFAATKVTDSKGNSYSLLYTTGPDPDFGFYQVYVYGAFGIASGSNTITATNSEPTVTYDVDVDMVIVEYSGLTGVFDASNANWVDTNVSPGGTVSDGGLTTTHVTEVVLSMVFDTQTEDSTSTWTPSSPWSKIKETEDSNDNATLAVADQEVTSIGSYSATWTFSGTGPDTDIWVAVVSLVGSSSSVLTVTASDSLSMSDSLSLPSIRSEGFQETLSQSDSMAMSLQDIGLALSSSFLTFNSSTSPAPQTVLVTATDSSVHTLSMSSDSSWLAVTPSSGTTPQTITVSVDSSGLAPGNYNGNITVTGSTVILPVSFIVVGAGVTISAGGTTLGLISASGSEASFTTALYKYANLTLPYNPNDPGLQYTYNNSTLSTQVFLAASFFNLLNEPSNPVIFDVGTSVFSVSVSGQYLECLDVRQFGAVGDGVTDDTAAIQAALNQAASNYQAIVAALGAQQLGFSGNVAGFGPTKVCIPSGLVCIVTPTWDDQRDRSGPSWTDNSLVTYAYNAYPSTGGGNGVGNLQFTTGNPNYPLLYIRQYVPGMACLLMDDGVTLEIDGTVKIGRTSTTDAYLRANFKIAVWAIQSKNAFIQGPFATVSSDGQPVPEPVPYSWFQLLSAVSTTDPTTGGSGFEIGPRNSDILITGVGGIDCSGDLYQTYPTVSLPAFVTTSAVCFCKCDNSEVNNISITNFVGTGVYYGHSVGAKIQNLRLSDSFSNAIWNPAYIAPGAIMCDVLRSSAVFQNFGQNLAAGMITLALCQHMEVTNNKLQQSGSQYSPMIASRSVSMMYGWALNEDFNTDTDTSYNSVTFIRGAIWQPNTIYELFPYVCPTVTYTNSRTNPDGTDFYAQFISQGLPDSGGFGYYAVGISGPTEPTWPAREASGSGTVNDAVVTVTGEFLGNGGDQEFDGSRNLDFFTFAPVLDVTDLQVFRNAELLSIDTDYTFTAPNDITFVSAPADADVISVNYTTQIAWTSDSFGVILDARGIPQNDTQNPYDAAVEPPHYGRGFRFTNNVITDNDCLTAIQFAGLNSALFSQNYIARSTISDGDPAILELFDLSFMNPYFPYTDSAHTAIVDNTIINQDGTPGTIETNTPTLTIDNPQLNPNTITRGGTTQNFFNIVQGETPGGAINGSNVTFTLVNTPQTGTLELFLNGLLLTPTTDYSVTGNTITMVVAPNSGSVMIANYEY
jgi:hypothetical protein